VLFLKNLEKKKKKKNQKIKIKEQFKNNLDVLQLKKPWCLWNPQLKTIFWIQSKELNPLFMFFW